MNNSIYNTSCDRVTIMSVIHPPAALATKRLYRKPDGSIGKREYDRPYMFDAITADVSSLAELVDLLRLLEDYPSSFIIRGLAASETCSSVRRLSRVFPMAAGHRWMMVDFDDIALPFCLSGDEDHEFLVAYLVRQLPPEFANTSYFYQWSSGAGIKHGRIDWRQLRCHIWFWLDRPVSDLDLQNWAKTFNANYGGKLIDPQVYVTVQPNYTAAPIRDAEVPDPLSGAPRSGFIRHASDAVKIVLPPIPWDEERGLRARAEHDELEAWGLREPNSFNVATNRFAQFLDDLGDDRDGFHGPLTSAVASWVSTHDASGDAELKSILRERARAAVNNGGRDLDDYLSDDTLDRDIAKAREKFGLRQNETVARENRATAELIARIDQLNQKRACQTRRTHGE